MPSTLLVRKLGNSSTCQLLRPTIAALSYPHPYSRRGICRKEHIDPEIIASKPPPFPYDRRKFKLSHFQFWRIDRTVDRWDENSKVICIEGPLACGKTKFGMDLADALGMRYYGIPDDTVMFNNENGDLRTLNWKLPEPAQYVDLKLFHTKPTHRAAVSLQFLLWFLKGFHYLEGLTHLFHTGQGVIHHRSPWSDIVFMEALVRMGAGGFAEDTLRHMKDIRREGLTDLKKPHLIIYLDVPPEKTLENIKKRNIPWEVNSPLFKNLDYLKFLDEEYKIWLHEMAYHSEIIKYDWSEGGDMDLVIEDLEKLDFDQYEKRGPKLAEWRHYRDLEYDAYRYFITNQRWRILRYWTNHEFYDVPNIQFGNDIAEIHQLVLDGSGMDKAPGWRIKDDKGDIDFKKALSVLFKPGLHFRDKQTYEYFGRTLRDKWTQLSNF